MSAEFRSLAGMLNEILELPSARAREIAKFRATATVRVPARLALRRQYGSMILPRALESRLVDSSLEGRRDARLPQLPKRKTGPTAFQIQGVLGLRRGSSLIF